MRQTHISWLVSALAALSWSCRVEPEPGEPPADPVADMSPASDMGGGDAADATADGRADFERDAGAEPAADMEVDAPADATPAAWVSRLGSAAMTGGFNPAGFGGTEVYRAIDVGPEGEVWGIATVAGPATGLDGQMVGEQGRVTSALVRWSARGELLGGTELRARGEGDLFLYDVATREDGSAVACGTYVGELELGQTRLVGNPERANGFVVGLDAAGELRWLQPAGTGTFAAAGECVPTANGAWVIGTYGGRVEFGAEELLSRGSLAGFVARIDRERGPDRAWSISASGDVLLRGLAVAADESQDVFVSGMFQGRQELARGGELVSAGDFDSFVTRFDASGQARWTRQMSAAAAVAARGVLHDLGEDVLGASGAFGQTLEVGSRSVTSRGGDDLFLAELDASTGEVLELRAAGTAQDEEGAEIARGDARGSWLLCGSTRGRLDVEGEQDWDMLLVDFSEAEDAPRAGVWGGSGEDRSFACERRGEQTVVAGWFSGAATFPGGRVESAGDDDAVAFATTEGRDPGAAAGARARGPPGVPAGAGLLRGRRRARALRRGRLRPGGGDGRGGSSTRPTEEASRAQTRPSSPPRRSCSRRR